ncbi:RNase H domain-containing protein [Trichonephila clavipes]|uniref:RNase H domain-containing protein n=1 Tax=Trichonephila clavipes TaxID=2585209 RepID=A0A8X6SR69_TRICX|nr:RNase H domain-containing protein [Trichonephila clavipes]
MDSTGLDILSKLVRLDQRKQICLQWIPSHVGVPGNEAADELAGRGCDLPNPSSTILTHSEIPSFQSNKMNLTWRNPPAHHWYAAKSPGLSIQCRSSRAHQTALTRFRSGHLRSMTLVQGNEAHFWLNGYVNKQNCRIWSEANPQVYVEAPLHPEKLTVWCALWAGGIIGPYFFKNDEGHNVTVNGDRYRAMITNFFIPELNNHDVQELWFQQDGATCHTARATIDLLKDTFGDRLVSRFGPVNWPPRCDLTPLDYFL